MPAIAVEFQFITGLKRKIFRNARLRGSWDSSGKYSDEWTDKLMQEITGEDGCPVFAATVTLDDTDPNQFFKWGVVLDGPQGSNFWGIPTEIQDVNSALRFRQFRLDQDQPNQIERYHFTCLRRLGANKRFIPGDPEPKLHFAVWAPNAQAVEVVFGLSDNGYIDDGGGGIDLSRPVVPLLPSDEGIWESRVIAGFTDFMSQPYMYRLKSAEGEVKYRTDIFSRSQAGQGSVNPQGASYPGTPDNLDGTVSCSVVIDPDLIRRGFSSAPPGELPMLISADDFWATEFTSALPVPSRVEDLVIYELHVGSLGFGRPDAGNLGDAIHFLEHLVDLGINTVELLPMAEFSGTMAWGYGDSHHLCIEASAGGRDKYRHFVRECHRRGIAVTQDVVYNHYDPNAERAQWQYDSSLPEENIYYWYEGRSSDYSQENGGYLDNGSTGYTPRFWDEIMRQQFISAAAFLIEEMHVDGLRVDLTQAIHRDNVLHADGRGVGNANLFGQKFLREWSRTLKMIKPSVMLIAEDHTEWDMVIKPAAQGGLGFDARWEVAFYHHLIGDSDMAGDKARLLKQAGYGGSMPLEMDRFSAALYNTQHNQVVFHESHDEAGNAAGTARTMVVAVNYAPIIGATRMAAEARSRLCFGLAFLSAGTPMFFMGEEIGARQHYTYNNFLVNREDIIGERTGEGASLFKFYQELITLGRRLRSVRSHNIDILHCSNENRVIAFKRWSADEEIIIVASLKDSAFANGYVIAKDLAAIPIAGWKEIFNSDAAAYGGRNVGNGGAVVWSGDGRVNVVIPACGFVVLVKQSTT